MSKELKRRPSGHDYRAELEQRFRGAHLCHMDSIGGSSSDRKPYQVAERIAIIDIVGVLCNDAWYLDETEYSQIQREARMASEDQDADGILLRICSPGGETDNAFETAAVLSQCAEKKPMWAVADNIAYSAAFLMASTAAKIYVPPVTGGVGSVGVYAAHVDMSALLEKAGVKVTFISAGKGKVDGNPYEPLSESARKQMQAEVDRLYGAFVATVATGRGMTPEDIRKIGAQTFHGSQQAIGIGYADVGGTLEQAWFELATASQAASKSIFSMAASAMTSHKEVPSMTGTGTEKPADANAKPPVDAAASNASAEDIAKAKAEGYADAEAVIDLCMIAGKPLNDAHDFIGKRTSAADVRKQLAAERVKAAGADLQTQVLPHEGVAAEAKPEKSLKERMAEKFGLNKGGK
jgi:signal peptide peptidase SppA